MDALEERLEHLDDGTPIEAEAARGACAERRATHDEAKAALRALADIGALVRGSSEYTLDRTVLRARAPYRAGIRAGLSVPRAEEPTVRLCAALPPGLASAVEHSVRGWTEDLRGALVDLVAHAATDLVLASPFWDITVLGEMAPALARRLEAGVRVRLLGRFQHGVPRDVAEVIERFSTNRGCEVLSWYEAADEDAFGARTFHFKAAVADGGARAYLGTANFTESGLRSRLELGVLLEAEAARRVSRVVEAVLGLARPVRPGWGGGTGPT